MADEDQELHVVFGAGGNLGQAVVRELLRRSKLVRAVVRNGRSFPQAIVETVQGDAADPSSTQRICEGATVVYNCANPPYTKWPELFPALQQGIIAGAAAHNALLVSAENTYMYGDVDRPFTEEMPYQAHTRKGMVRAQMAQELMAAHEQGQVRVIMGRAADFYGPGVLRTNMGERVFLPALTGKKAAIIGNLDVPRDYIFVDDFAQGLVTLAENETAVGQVWHIPNAPTLTQGELVNLIYEEADQTPNVEAIPGMMVKGLGLFNPHLREVAEMLYEFKKPFVIDSSKYQKAFGNQATPHREAIRQTLVWYRQTLK